MLAAILILAGSALLFLCMILAGWVISGYNHLVNGRVNISTQWSNIKTEYQRRADMFYNLVQTVKSHKKFEKETLTAVVQARSGAFIGNGPKATQAKKMKELDSFFARLLAVFEAYPNLKSYEQHNKLMDEVRITEDRINVARTDYNDVVRTYNIYVKSFPSNIIAKMFAYKAEEFYLNEEQTNTAPKIQLD